MGNSLPFVFISIVKTDRIIIVFGGNRYLRIIAYKRFFFLGQAQKQLMLPVFIFSLLMQAG